MTAFVILLAEEDATALVFVPVAEASSMHAYEHANVPTEADVPVLATIAPVDEAANNALSEAAATVPTIAHMEAAAAEAQRNYEFVMPKV